MKGKTDPRVKAARAAHKEAGRKYDEAEAAVSAAKAALDGAQEAREESRIALRKAGLLLDLALGLDVCEMVRFGAGKRVVITRRTKASVWVRDYGWPDGSETRFVLSRGTWRRHGDGHRPNPTILRGVP